MRKAVLTIAAALLCATPAFAEDAKMPMDHKGHGDMQHMDHGDMKKMDHKSHGDMQHMEAKEIAPGTEAAGSGVVNSIDTGKKQVNLTHEPMPDLGWPSMTMDLPVTSKVDLGSIKAGEKVSFKLKLGRDKAYRIIELAPAK